MANEVWRLLRHSRVIIAGRTWVRSLLHEGYPVMMRLSALAALLLLSSILSAAPGQLGAEDSMSPAAIKERIKPVGGVCVQGDECKPAGLAFTPLAGDVGGARTGEQVYNAVCTACHGSGVAGAPKTGDVGAWRARITQGEKTLVQHALNGFTGKTGMMPAKGGCASCSDEEISNAVQYLISKVK